MTLCCLLVNISLGSVSIPISSVFKTLIGQEAAKETWENARANAAPRGRPQASADELVVGMLSCDGEKKKHWVQNMSVFLTYFGAWTLAL